MIDLAVGAIDTNGDTCGVGGSTPCYVVVVGTPVTLTASVALGFTLPSIAVSKTTSVLGNYADALKASGFPIGDTVVAQECDASASGAEHGLHALRCLRLRFRGQAATERCGRPEAHLRSGVATRTVRAERAKPVDRAIGVTDSDNSAIGASASVGFASPAFSLKETTNVIGNYVDAVKAAGFPIGDTIVAQECDPSLVIPSTAGSNCDAQRRFPVTAGPSGKVAFSSTGVTLRVGGGFSDSASGVCPVGGTCEVLVSDSSNPSVGLDEAVTFATPDGDREGSIQRGAQLRRQGDRGGIPRW